VIVLAVMAGQGGVSGQRHMTPEPVAVTVDAIPHLKIGAPSVSRFGPFEFIGGFEMRGKHPNFGGISAIRVEADARRFLALTDTGDWLRGDIVYEGARPKGLAAVTIAPVLAADGRRAKDVGLWDAESIAKDGDRVFVGIEREHTLLSFDLKEGGLRARGGAVPLPAFVQRWWSNRGIEALGIMPPGGPYAGRLIGLSERSGEAEQPSEGFVMNRDGSEAFRFAIRRADAFDTTALDFLPNGDLVILERFFSPRRGVAMRLKRVRAAEIRPDAVGSAEILLTLDNTHHVDNMEGLSIHPGPDGGLVFTIVSDDNFSAAQRSLLLQFRWLGSETGANVVRSPIAASPWPRPATSTAPVAPRDHRPSAAAARAPAAP
ncbi:MAG: esterase-like activity of phytase family protein, partial [Beijerinckiaceae bacterium]